MFEGFDFGSLQNAAQDMAKLYVDRKTSASYQQPYEVQKMRLQAYDPFNGFYQEGQQTITGGVAGGINPTWLLVGGIILAVVLVKS